jgi:hypothetical protein
MPNSHFYMATAAFRVTLDVQVFDVRQALRQLIFERPNM